jgi:predicted MPP superfamily phosphohydrolase
MGTHATLEQAAASDGRRDHSAARPDVVLGFFIEPNRLVVRQETIEIDNWPQSLDGLRIAVISDIHVGGSFIDDKKLRSIVDRTNQLQPDIIILLGDYMSSNGWIRRRVEPEVFAPILKNFSAPLGTYSVLGNHDSWYDGQKVRVGLEQNGIKVLENEVVQINTRGTSFWLVGLADLWTRPQLIQETLAKVPEGQTVIALTPQSRYLPAASRACAATIGGSHAWRTGQVSTDWQRGRIVTFWRAFTSAATC